MIELKGIDGTHGQDPYAYLKELREWLSWRRGDAILLAEANLPMDTIPHYFGDGDRLHLIFNFWLNQHVFLGLASEEARPIAEAIEASPKLPSMAQWANFLRNHDEVDLGRLTDKQRALVFSKFGLEPRMQLYERGIRRRLLPMLGGDVERAKMAYSLMFSLPGTPVLWYGEEIGMGDDLSLPERQSVRTPMQWSAEANGGFSSAPRADLIKPVINRGNHGFSRVNAVSQRRDPGSLMNWLERLIRMRKECPEFGWGTCHVLDVEEPHVLAHCCEWRGGVVVAIHNLASAPVRLNLDLGQFAAEEAIDLLDDHQEIPIADGRHRVDLPAFGYRWLRLHSRQPPCAGVLPELRRVTAPN